MLLFLLNGIEYRTLTNNSAIMKNPFPLNVKFLINVLGILIVGLVFGCQKELIQTENIDDQAFAVLKSAEKNNFMVISASETLPDELVNGGDFDFYDLEGSQYDMILSTGNESYYFASGTSMASPHVAGVAALIISKNGGAITNHEVTKQLFKTADVIGGMKNSTLYFGSGRVNAYLAVTE